MSKRFRYQHYYTASTVDQLIYDLKNKIAALTTSLSNYLALTGGTLSGALTSSSTIQSLSATVFGYLANISSDVQAQFNALTASIALKLPLSGGTLTGNLTVSASTPTLKLYATANNPSSIVLQSVNTGSTSTDGGAMYLSGSDLYFRTYEAANINFVNTSGTILQINNNGNNYTYGSVFVQTSGPYLWVSSTDASDATLYLQNTTTGTSFNNGVQLVASGSNLNIINNSNGTLTLTNNGINVLTFSSTGNATIVGNLNSVTPTQLSYLTTITSDVQTQINTLTTSESGKLPLTGGALTGALTSSSTIQGIGSTVFGYLSTLTSNVQTQLNTLTSTFASYLPLTGGALTGALTTSSTIQGCTTTQMGYLSSTGGTLFTMNGGTFSNTADTIWSRPAGTSMTFTLSNAGANSTLFSLNNTYNTNGCTLQADLSANFLIINKSTTGNLKLQTNSTDRLTITSAGAATFSGALTCSSTLAVTGAMTCSSTIQGISSTIFGYLSTLTSNVQTQLNTLTSTFASYLPLSGGSITGAVNSSGYPITSKTYMCQAYGYGTSNGTWNVTASSSSILSTNSGCPNISFLQNLNGLSSSTYGYQKTTGRYVCPAAGWYQVNFSGCTSAQNFGFYFCINDVKYLYSLNTGGFFCTVTSSSSGQFSQLLPLNQGDYVTVPAITSFTSMYSAIFEAFFVSNL